jgi:hypothetical protein
LISSKYRCLLVLMFLIPSRPLYHASTFKLGSNGHTKVLSPQHTHLVSILDWYSRI